ncbi:MAG: hypothetical protein HAW67_07660 [Endozoicomonadaceae bacterium]|nr:hypothetical protein [Endozoicomonadaceae bacterium]
MKKNNDWFWVPFCFTMLGGVITGGIYEGYHELQTNDWAARGQPLFERWLDKQSWFIEGAIPGLILGLIVGILVWAYTYKYKKEEPKNLDDNSDNGGDK